MKSTDGQVKKWLRRGAWMIMCVLLLALYAMFWKSNDRSEICVPDYTFFALTLIYGSLSAALLFKRLWMPVVWRRLNPRVKRVLRASIWAAAPILCYLTTELAYNEKWKNVAWQFVGLNFLIYLVCGIELTLILGRERAAFILMELVALIYGIASHYVLEFKDTTLRPGELLGARTGLAVAGGYSYALTNGVVEAILLCMLSCILILFITGIHPQEKAKKVKGGKRLAIRFGMAAIVALLCYGVFQTIDVAELTGISIYAYRPGKTYKKAGSALCFLIDVQGMRIEKPEGYSAEKAEEILASYETEAAEEQTVQPNIIVVMNESFADLSVIGPFESDEYLSNLNSVTDYIMKGYAYVSVYGGSTCNSEFEFLTGSTMGFLGANVFPYQTVRFDGFTSMPGVFENLGYETIALHPSVATNWNREHVYSQMGFDTFISKSNGFEDAVKWNKKNSWIDDESDYRELIRQVEAAEGPLFLFNVTVQNHGGYLTSKLKDQELIEIEEKYADQDNAIAYLTGIKYSDMALGELIQYFRDCEDPTILCFFGDHQGMMKEEFLNGIEAANETAQAGTELDRRQNRYKVPYLIWSNYLEPEQTEMDLSLNYLGAWLLHYAGAMTPYAEYLLDLQNTVQAININGYMEDGTWLSLEEPDESLNQYEIVQYYRIFD